jgi:hypothetical protein
MKTALRLSILLNCCLAVLLVLLALNGRAPAPRLPSAAAPEATQEPTGEQAAPAAGAEPRPFHWSQLESSDYRTYIANLRGIGCPEQTLRDIVTADVGSLFAFKRQPLEAELSSLSSDSPGTHAESRPAVEAEILRLRRQEASLIEALLGPEAGAAGRPAETAAEAPAASGSPRQNPPDAVVSMPLVFQDVDLAALNLDSGQRQAIEELRQRFVEELGGPNQDPTAPAYRERWQQSQPENDGLLRGMIGVRAWQDYQLAARSRE